MRLMKWSSIKLNEIRKQAKNSLKYRDFNANSKTKIYLFYLYVLPVLFALLLIALGLFIEKEIASYLITSISIFAGLFFGLLFIVMDKYNQKKDNLKEIIQQGDEETRNYLTRYKNFSTILVRQISFTIILALALILSLSIMYFAPQFPKIDYCWYLYLKLAVKYLLNGIIYYWSVQFVVFLVVILSNMYVMLLDDINFEKSK